LNVSQNTANILHDPDEAVTVGQDRVREGTLIDDRKSRILGRSKR
jgi:hypothetical protein